MGLHQTGLHRQQEAEGGFIYLAYDPEVVGQENQELNRIGHVSGIDGIVSLLNRESERRNAGAPGPYTGTSRAVKYVYDRVHAAFDGRFDEGTGR